MHAVCLLSNCMHDTAYAGCARIAGWYTVERTGRTADAMDACVRSEVVYSRIEYDC
jgi:hypothetical protein